MKKNLKLLAVLLMATSLPGLASCGGSTGGKITGLSGNVTINFYSTMGTDLKNVFDPYIEMFQQEYPNIEVVHSTSSGGYDNLRDDIKTQLGNNEGPNLAYCYPDHVALYNLSGKVQTLDKFINDTEKDENGNLKYGLTKEQQDDFVPGYWNEGKSYGDGLMYSLPFSKSTEVLYYNKTVFDEMNLSVPTHWFKDDTGTGFTPENSMEYACEKLIEKYPNDIPLGYDSEANWFITLCEQYGADYTSTNKDNHFIFDNETTREFVAKLNGWREKNYFTTQSIEGTYTSSLFVNQDKSSKSSYMCIGSSAGASHQFPGIDTATENPYFEVGIAPIPQVNPNNKKVISQGPSICIFKKSNQDEVLASWLFLRYLVTNVPLIADFAMSSGYVPPIRSIEKNDIYHDYLANANGNTSKGCTALSAKVCNEQADYYFTSPAFVGSSDARDQVGALMSAVFTGSKSIDDAFKDALAECEAAIK